MTFIKPLLVLAAVLPVAVACSSSHREDADAASRQYVTEAAQGDMFERRASELALDKATSADVRAFAQMMLVDHDRTTDDLQEAIQRADIDAALPTKLDAKHQALLSALESKQGSAFDDSYAEIQQKAHRDALELHEGYRDTGTVEALRVVAIGAVPVIQRHLTLADRLP